MRTILLLVTASLVRVNSQQLQALFVSVPVTSECDAETATFALATRLECAAQAARSDSWRSFSFIGGVCALSSRQDCAGNATVAVFSKQIQASSASATTESPLSSTTSVPDAPLIGNETFVDGRRFWVFQQRQFGTASFARNWTEYERGFGDGTDFWSGLRTLNRLSQPGNCTLRMEVVTLNYTYYVAEWSAFTVADVSTNYIMSYGTYLTSSSNVSGDCFNGYKGMQFSTKDRDNDLSDYHFAVSLGNSGFWYGSEVAFNPNGLFSTVEQANIQYASCYYIHPSQTYATFRSVRLMLQI